MESVPGPDATREPRNEPEPMDENSAPITLNTMTSTSLLEGLGERDNRTIWHQFVERYRPMIAGYAQRMGLGSEDAEDAAQATLIAFCEAYQAGRYQREQGRLRSWLFGVRVQRFLTLRTLRTLRTSQLPIATFPVRFMAVGIEPGRAHL